MKLSVIERLTLLGVLPGQGNLITIKIIARLREELSFDEEEHKVLKFREVDDGKRMRWEEPYPHKDVEFGAKAISIVYDSLKVMDDKEALGEQHLSLCEKFGYPEEE